MSSVIARVAEGRCYVSADAGVTWTPLQQPLTSGGSVSITGTPTVNVTQFGTNNVATGIGAAGVGIPRVTVSDDNTETTGTISGAAQTFQVALAGRSGAGAEILAGTLAATVVYEYSADGGTTWSSAVVVVGGGQNLTGTVLTNPNPVTSVAFVTGEHWTHVRVRCSAYTSGSAGIQVRATKVVSPLAVGALNVGTTLAATAIPFFANLNGLKAVTGNLPTAFTNGTLVPMLGDVYGRLTVKQRDTWWINHAPAAATQATITQAAGAAGVKNVCTGISISLSFAVAPAAGVVQFNLRDGATGAGAILQTWKLSTLAGTLDTQHIEISGMWVEGTAATAMTLESAAAPGAGVVATVSMTGTITQ